ncbi:DNA translocase FtsK 4TM domain-containing protein [Thioalkalicoccus limnaeus]|uniref:DNA translocase FtsK n=1 Tax=Thioalkalicoccus limnaeus TaxID=120681 RepID=A0ABV4BHJ7_9GAMM
MSQATRQGRLSLSEYLERALREGAMWSLVCVAIYLVIALASYSPEDPGWSYLGPTDAVANLGGPFGAWFADVTLFLFGFLAYLIPLMVAWSGYLLFRRREPEVATHAYLVGLRWIGFLLTLAAGCALAATHPAGWGDALPNGAGGGLGDLISRTLTASFKPAGATIFTIALFLVGFGLFTGLSWLLVIDGVGELVLSAFRWVRAWPIWQWRPTHWFPARVPLGDDGPDPAVEPVTRVHRSGPWIEPDEDPAMPEPSVGRGNRSGDPPADHRLMSAEALARLIGAVRPKVQAKPRPAPEPKPAAKLVAPRRPAPPPKPIVCAAERPPLDLLDAPRRTGRGFTDQELDELSLQVKARLKEFGVEVNVVAVYPGPVVTLFELQLAAGTKVSKITGLAKDLARALSTISVRVVEVIPGKSVIGLEIPNKQRETVFLREILSSPGYQEAKSPLILSLGTDIAGHPVVADLARMPHALIAGTTGSGKSVAINAMILSLVYKASPRDVRLIMVDPKMLELSVYEGIPHLLTPVVTDMKEAANALRWCVGEMERRYRLMSQMGVRNIGGYNRQVAEAEAAGTPIPDPMYVTEHGGQVSLTDGEQVPTLSHLPYIVVIIDELADMMMVVGKKVEELIARLAQKARASGIHLLLATQRPSVDVLTGLIKANIPTRIAFQVSARVDSRTVLDQMGAEQLLGNGDMLYLAPGGSIPRRVHGAFVDDHEVHRVVEYLRETGDPDYIADVLREPDEFLPGIDPEPRGGDVEDVDPLFDEAVQIVVETRRASISGVQRRLKIGYNRAARMVEEMERIGLVGPAETNGSREVLVPPPDR